MISRVLAAKGIAWRELLDVSRFPRQRAKVAELAGGRGMTRIMGCAWARIAMAAATMLVALRRGGLAP